MTSNVEYKINTGIKYDYLQLIDVPEVVKNCTDKWFNQTLCKVNDAVLRLGILEGTFHWHKHEREDEVFFVLIGNLVIETEKGNFDLKEQQGVCVPKGIKHRPIAEKKAVVLMVENRTIKPIGD